MEETGADADADDGAETNTTTKRKTVSLTREAGKSLLPFTRVQKIVKADKDIPIMARDATFLISLATEEFIKRLTQAGQRVAEKEKRTTVQNKDLVSTVRKVDEFLFLEEIITSSEPQPKRAPKAAGPKTTESSTTSGPTLLDQFVAKSNAILPGHSESESQSQNVITNEDGTMESLPDAQS
ncbi:hypothetical protein K435DRAFT_649350 [Dendrothele bispora CBS 962.96]|uniref:Transcription factor CBF/NF-Y/archaeal histone domain-containing protein n=1 Tax=Dendrothele bispora (strain CBS 962.96) TaxID=1314807 RepID=A0A4V4HHY1_DENBC|nr:hypothetical protein K435DRAFT_649350 [Dendrothele bispora CBS 962.96]